MRNRERARERGREGERWERERWEREGVVEREIAVIFFYGTCLCYCIQCPTLIYSHLSRDDYRADRLRGENTIFKTCCTRKCFNFNYTWCTSGLRKLILCTYTRHLTGQLCIQNKEGKPSGKVGIM